MQGNVNIGSGSSRYDRQERIAWWDQDRLRKAKILLIGAGALGNEVAKNLGLLGVGQILIFDMDDIEISNLARCVFFHETNKDQNKAQVLAERITQMNSDVTAIGRGVDVIGGAGLGVFAWADVVIGAVDNRATRVFINKCCALVGRPWVDGGIEELSGIVRVFRPADGVCYECTMGAVDRKLLQQRLSCAMLARRAVNEGRTPTTAVSSSFIGALQAQEAVKLLHGQTDMIGTGVQAEGLSNIFERVNYRMRADCPGHAHCSNWIGINQRSDATTFEDLLTRAERQFSGEVRLELSRDIIVKLICPTCNVETHCGKVLGTIWEDDALCPDCGTHRILDFQSSVGRDDEIDLSLTLTEAGLPPIDGVIVRQKQQLLAGYLMDGDTEGFFACS
ncbi:MAG: HesA/MoeB/ThiF family protein [Geminicoccaceae bacterium]